MLPFVWCCLYGFSKDNTCDKRYRCFSCSAFIFKFGEKIYV